MSSERQRYEFPLPDPGEGLTEAEIDEWFVEKGQEVDDDGPLCEVETDKALVEIPIPCPGLVVELRAEPGDVVRVGEIIAVFETDDPPRGAGAATDDGQAEPESEPANVGESGSAAPGGDGVDEADGEARSAVTRVTPEADESAENGSTDGERAFAAPSTRRYAREKGVDLTAIEGSGPGGRVLREDVDAYAERGSAAEAKSAATEESAATSSAGSTAASTGASAETVEIDESGEVVRRPLRGLRKTVAENMVRSKQTIPHVTSGYEADARDLVALKERLDEKLDARITYTALVMKAVVPALEEFPLLNASIDDESEEIVEKRYYNLGVATHTGEGLMVPVVENVDEKSLEELGTELADLVERTRERDVEVSELRGGTFTITNTGSHSEHGTFGTPIIRHPESAIMGVGRIQNEPVAVSDTEMEVRKVLPLTLSYDHRLIDGVTATEFMEYVIEAIEDSDVLLSRL
ncbi:dihydrolipoamide acetyltransferase family protein [Salinirubellus sp. GCM10025818]|uniref:dihydrolipoamide acetyltransferase family protein n=1 Tax=Salinirubellus TaxID=2162630 RepID=UPI0030D6112A